MRFILVLISILLITGPAHAQDWFEIEVIIFEHQGSQLDAENAERWPRDLDLAWPSPLLELEPAVERTEPPEIFPPFEELKFDQRRLNNASYALRVREPYELLWHKAWRAPLLDEGLAPWILVQAGEQLGEHYRLEGAIRIHLSRYLHLSTNLWLTDTSGGPVFEEASTTTDSVVKPGKQQQAKNQKGAADNPLLSSLLKEGEEQSEFDWSQLPTVQPVRWGCNHVRERWPEDSRLLPEDYFDDPAPADWYYPFGCQVPSELIEQDLPYGVALPTSQESTDAELQLYYPEMFMQPESVIPSNSETLPLGDLTRDGLAVATISEDSDAPEHLGAIILNTESLLNEDDSFGDFNLNQGFEPELIPPKPRVHYPIKEIIHIVNKRRMRSTEFHYLDHPRIGVLAIIHPVEKPKLVLEPEEEGSLE